MRITPPLRVFDLVGRRVLVTRESARSLGPALSRAAESGDDEIVLDFAGVEGVTPSLLDEILAVVESYLDEGEGGLRVMIRHPPTRLSVKFEAVGRGRGLAISEGPDGWVVRAES